MLLLISKTREDTCEPEAESANTNDLQERITLLSESPSMGIEVLATTGVSRTHTHWPKEGLEAHFIRTHEINNGKHHVWYFHLCWQVSILRLLHQEQHRQASPMHRWKTSWKLSLLPANSWADRGIPQIAERKSDDWIYYQPSSGATISQPSPPCSVACQTLTKHASDDRYLTVNSTRMKCILKKEEIR